MLYIVTISLLALYIASYQSCTICTSNNECAYIEKVMLFLPSQLLFYTNVPINHSDPTSLPMRGLEAIGNDRIALTFHVIVPVACWEWDSESRIHIRFGHNELGNWRDCGEFKSRCTHCTCTRLVLYFDYSV